MLPKSLLLTLFLAATSAWHPQVITNPLKGATQQIWAVFNRSGSGGSPNQCFTPANVSLAGTGFAVITAIQQTAQCVSIDLPLATYSYTSGYFSMKTFNFQYGTIEFRAQFGPCNGGSCNSSGSWPAIWMNEADCQVSDPTGTNNNCTEQEIDLAEILCCNFGSVNQQIHTPNYGGHNDGCSATVSDTSLNFHVYDTVWSAGSLLFYIDGTLTCSIVQSYVPSQYMYVKADIYVGANGGSINNATLPWLTSIDYLRIGTQCTGVNPMSGCEAVPFDAEFN